MADPNRPAGAVPSLPPGLFGSAPLAVREREYSPSSCIGGNYQPFIAAYRERSERARVEAAAAGGRWLRHTCGIAPRPALELCLPRAASPSAAVPLLLFVHGGYWQELAAADSLFAATACVRRGMGFAALDYTLAPTASVQDIVAECSAALRWLAREAAALGVARERVVIAGSSAGAHLCAAMAQQAVLEGAGAIVVVPKAMVLMSGIYWLEPLIGTSIDAALHLDIATARRASPGLASLTGAPPAVVAWGDNETAAFKAQSRHFAAALIRTGTACQQVEVAGRNHFDVVFDLMDETTPLGQKVLALFD